MTTTNVTSLDSSIQSTNEWLKEIQEEGGFETRQQAYSTLRATLHALRDRLPADEAAHLGAGLPLIIRGMYYEGWRPSAKPARIDDQEGFINSVKGRFGRTPRLPADDELFPAVAAIFHVLGRHINAGEIEDVRANLPPQLRDIFA